MKTGIMVDFETLGLDGRKAAVLSGAVIVFTEMDFSVVCHQRFPLLEQIMSLGREVSPDVLSWWQHPDRAPARSDLLEMQETPTEAFADRLRNVMKARKPVQIWSSSKLDIDILESLFRVDTMPGWRYDCYRDVRTERDHLSQEERESIRSKRRLHNAQADALTSIELVQKSWDKGKF